MYHKILSGDQANNLLIKRSLNYPFKTIFLSDIESKFRQE